MPETKKQKENRRHRQYEETAKMEQEDKNSYLREFLPKNLAPKFTMQPKNKVDIENFIELYPQYKKKLQKQYYKKQLEVILMKKTLMT